VAAQRSRTIVCDVSALAADASAVDALARLQLAVRRLGHELRLRHASNELQQLLQFVGLDGVLRVEAGGEPEEREEPLGVQEERELDDPPVGDLEHL
jgi:anti-anti-sigma regulatory factor